MCRELSSATLQRHPKSQDSLPFRRSHPLSSSQSQQGDRPVFNTFPVSGLLLLRRFIDLPMLGLLIPLTPLYTDELSKRVMFSITSILSRTSCWLRGPFPVHGRTDQCRQRRVVTQKMPASSLSTGIVKLAYLENLRDSP